MSPWVCYQIKGRLLAWRGGHRLAIPRATRVSALLAHTHHACPRGEEALVPGVEDSSSEAPRVASPSLSTVSQGKKGTLEPGVLTARLPETANSVTQAWCLTTRGAGLPALRTGQSGRCRTENRAKRTMPHWYAFSLRCFLRLPPMSKIGSSAWNLRSQQSNPGLRCGCCSPRRRSQAPACLAAWAVIAGPQAAWGCPSWWCNQ